jgi:hypothetical protein
MVIWTAILVASVSILVSAGENILKNSGFEAPINQSSDWRLQQWAGSEPGAFVIDETQKYEGAKSLKIVHQNESTYSVAFQPIAVEPNTWYLFSGYAKADRDLSGYSNMPAKFFVMNNQTDSTIAFKPIVSTQWQEISFVFNSGEATSILAICYLYKKVASIWCDKMSLAKVAGPNIVIDKTEVLSDGIDQSQITVSWPEFGNLALATKIRLVGQGTAQITPADRTLGGGQSSATFTVKSLEPGVITLELEAYSDEVDYGTINWFWWKPPAATITLNFLLPGGGRGENLLKNSGFEEQINQSSDWRLQQWAGSEPNAFVIDETQKYEGAKSLKIVHQSESTYSVAFQPIIVEPNTWYLFSGYAKADRDLSGYSNMPAKFFIMNNQTDSTIAFKPIVSTQWQEVSFVFNTGEATSIRVMCYLYLKIASIWCDKMSLSKVAGPAVTVDKTEILGDGIDQCEISVYWPEFGNLAAATKVRLMGRATEQITPAEKILGGGQSFAAFTVRSSQPGDVIFDFEAYSDEVDYGVINWFWWKPPLESPIALTIIPVEDGENLLRNSDFEQYNSAFFPLEWSGNTDGQETEAIACDRAVKYRGTASLRLRHATQTSYSSVWQTVAVEPNRWYLLTGYGKTEQLNPNPDNSYPARIALSDQQGVIITDWLVTELAWQKFEISFNSGNRTAIKVNCDLYLGSGTVWFDALAVKEKQTVNLLSNPGFNQIDSSQGPAEWYYDVFQGSETGTVVCEQGVKYEGTASLRIKHQLKNTYSAVWKNVTVKPNTWYRLTGYAKRVIEEQGQSGWEPARFFIGDQNGNTIINKPVLSAEWEQISLAFNSGSRSTIQVYCYLNNAKGTVWFDALCLEESSGPLQEEELRLAFSIPSYFDGAGNLMLNQQPFFPFGFYDVNDVSMLNQVAAAGINTVELDVSRVTEQFMTTAANLGVKVIICFGYSNLQLVKDTVRRWKGYSALLGWYIYDEPDMRGIHRREFFEIYKAVKEIDPARPVTTAFASPPRFKEFADGVDMIMPDPYPVPASPLSKVTEACQAAKSALEFEANKTLFATLQAFAWEGQRPPTPAEMRAMVYLALANDVKGILNFTFAGYGQYLPTTHPALWAELVTLSEEIRVIEQILFWPTERMGTNGDGAIAYLVKEEKYDGTTKIVYVIAANGASQTKSLTVELGERPDSIQGAQSAQILDYGFSEQIEGFGVRVYQVNFY